MNYPSIQYCRKRGRIIWFTFCLVNVKGFNKKNKQHLKYPRIPSAILTVAHSEEIPVPIFTKLPKIDYTDLYSPSSSDEEDTTDIFQPCDEDCNKPILFTQSALNDLVRDLYLPKESAELLASRLQENRMLKPGTMHFVMWCKIF